jgi:uncharacterized protein YhdP
LGGPATLNLVPVPEGGFRATLAGRLTAEGVAPLLGSPWGTAAKGGTAYRLVVTVKNQQSELDFASDLTGLALALPPPLEKAANGPLPLRLTRRVVDVGRDQVSVSVGNVLAMELLRRLEDDAPRVEKGTVRLGGGAAPAPVQPGVWVDGELPALDVDAWRAWLSAEEGPGLPLAGIHLRVKTIDFLARRFHNMHLNAWSQGSQWQATLTADELSGDASWRSHGSGNLTARLKRLAVPEALEGRSVAPAGGKEVELPGLDVLVEEFELLGRKLGRLELLAAKQGADWRIERARLSNPDAVLSTTGVWQSWLARPATRLTLDLDVKDIGRLLARLGHPDRIRRGTAHLSGEVSWRGGPASFNLASLSGKLTIEAHSGQFLKIEPGVGKLLGLISLQSLPRRLILDFRDVFSEGFAFDNIAGTALIESGVLSTQDFVMQGPSAVVSLSGSTALVRETQNLRIKVVPAVGGVAAAGAFLGGPVVGVTALILQRLLKDPLGQMIAYEYQVTGTWDDPKVEKIGHGGERP